MRLFTAIELSPAVLGEVSRVQTAMQEVSDFKRWQALHQAHVTVSFLGDVSPDLLKPLESGLKAACAKHAAFELGLGSVGAFGKSGAPRVVWLGLNGDLESLRGLEATTRMVIQQLGVGLEDRAYKPHITLAREFRSGEWSGVAVEPLVWRVDHLALVESKLLPSGAEHTVLAKFPLG